MKKIYKAPALRESKLKALTLLAGSLDVDPTVTTQTQYSKQQNSIFDSAFGNDDEVEE